MTVDDATQLIRTLQGSIPTTTSEQAFYLKRELLKYDFNAAQVEIDRYISRYPAVVIPRLLEMLRETIRPSDSVRERFATERAQTSREWRDIEGKLNELSEDDLARHKQAVLATLDPQLRVFLKDSDPRKSAVLRSLIYRRLGV